MTNFTQSEIELIKIKIKKELDKTCIIVLLFMISLCPIILIAYLHFSNSTLVEKYGFSNAVLILTFSNITILALIWLWKNLNINSQFRKHRKYLRKKQLELKVLDLRKSYFPPFENILIPTDQKDFKKISLSNEQSKKIKTGDSLILNFEEQTRTIFNIMRLN